MGNCTGYCMSEDPNGKRKITVEQKDGDAAYANKDVAYINEQRQEFEIEYGAPVNKAQAMDGANGQFAGKAGGYEASDKITNMGPTTQANGSTYTGQRKNGKKHGHGIQVWPDSSRYEGQWENDQANG